MKIDNKNPAVIWFKINELNKMEKLNTIVHFCDLELG